MKLRHALLVVPAIVPLLALWACSSDSPTTSTPPTVDASRLDGGNPDSPAPPPPGDDGGAEASDCGTAPTLHPPKADAGVYCPFSGVDGGPNVTCAPSEQCCETPAGTSPSSCVALGTPCPVAGSTVWECEDPADCAGQRCCAYGSDGGAVTLKQDPVCGPFLSHFGGTRCSAACAPTGELTVCEEQPTCGSGTCKAVKPKGNSVGVCD